MAKIIPVTETVTRCYTNAMVKNEAKFSLVQKYYALDILVGAFESFVPEFQIQTSIYGHDCHSTYGLFVLLRKNLLMIPWKC